MKTALFWIPAAALLLASNLQSPSGRKASSDVPAKAAELLSRRCLGCHNTDNPTASIDLSRRSSASKMGLFGKGGRLLQVVSEGKMPPTGKLKDDEVALLRQWDTDGARYLKEPLEPFDPLKKSLWSFRAVVKPGVPKTPFHSMATNEIDKFVFRELAARGLKPSPLADRPTLLRRVSIDLTGLPPTPEEQQAFLADKSPRAYEKVVNRLLASPAYGERWGRHWLDVVRYGESHGYEQNHLRPTAWHYRDYVINAFNDDVPYNQFVAEQLAGDVIAKVRPAAESGTGFLVAGIHDTVGISNLDGQLQQRSNDLDDMVGTTSAAFLGLTVACARCHDHKFDPIPQRDYYRLMAVFSGVRHAERPLVRQVNREGDHKESEELSRKIQQVSDAINVIESAARETVLKSRGKTSTRPAVSARRNLDVFAPTQAKFVRFTILGTKDGTEPCIDELQIFGENDLRNLALASGGAKASASSLLPGYTVHQIQHLNDGRFGNEFSWISNTRGTGWAQIELPEPARIQRVAWSRDAGDIPRFDDRIAVSYRIETSLNGVSWSVVSTNEGRASFNDYIHPDDLKLAMTPEQQARRKQLSGELGTLRAALARVQASYMAYIGQFTTPDRIRLLRRGDVMQPADDVAPGGLSLISAHPGELGATEASPETDRRLNLAMWIGNERNPLTPRVMVNRIWQHHFGRGIVATPSDFGQNGAKPSHPELLDWLAAEFMKPTRGTPTPWSIKNMHRLMVHSYTYRQASAPNPTARAKDAGNVYLWRMPVRRLEAESIRDAILQTSGKLDRTMGGPSFRLFKYNVVNVAIYDTLEEYGPETWRRSVYQQAARSISDELLSVFDCPESSQRSPKRDSTTTALQALSLLNGPFMTQQSEFMAARVAKLAAKEPTAQAQGAFRLAFGRSAKPAELNEAVGLVKAHGLATLCRALLNANEFLYY